jgi:hypothetical protein
MAGLDGWFQGRELVETLRIRVAAAEGRSQEALQMFDAARNLAEHADVSSAAWLTASVADVLFAIDPQHLKSAMERFSQDVGTLGFAELTRKYQDLQGLQAQDESGETPHS